MSELSERDQFWLSHIEAAEGVPLSRYAAEHDLSVGVLYAAKSRLKRKGVFSPTSGSRFVPVMASSSASANEYRVLLRNGAVVEVRGEHVDVTRLLDAASRLT